MGLPNALGVWDVWGGAPGDTREPASSAPVTRMYWTEHKHLATTYRLPSLSPSLIDAPELPTAPGPTRVSAVDAAPCPDAPGVMAASDRAPPHPLFALFAPSSDRRAG